MQQLTGLTLGGLDLILSRHGIIQLTPHALLSELVQLLLLQSRRLHVIMWSKSLL